VLAAALVALYVTLLRFDLSMVPIALATMVAVAALARGAQRAFPGALAGSIAAVFLIAGGAFLFFGLLRKQRQSLVANPESLIR
jgi:hypothetical protein